MSNRKPKKQSASAEQTANEKSVAENAPAEPTIESAAPAAKAPASSEETSTAPAKRKTTTTKKKLAEKTPAEKTSATKASATKASAGKQSAESQSADSDPASARPGRTAAKRTSAAAKRTASSEIESVAPTQPAEAPNRPAAEKGASKPKATSAETAKAETPKAETAKSKTAKAKSQDPSASATAEKKSTRASKGKQAKSNAAESEVQTTPAPAAPGINAKSTSDDSRASETDAGTIEPLPSTPAPLPPAPEVAPGNRAARSEKSPESAPAPADSHTPASEGHSHPAQPKSERGRGRRGGRGRRKGQGGESQNGSGENRQPAQENRTTTAEGRTPLPPVKPAGRRWYKVDLHMHTMASSDYEDPQLSWLDWLRTVAERGLEIVAIADHNTVRGIATMRNEIEWLTRLEALHRLNDQERADLAAWRDLSNRVLVLPGFEFTATFGFHILGIFPPETSVRTLEQLLLKLNVPPEKLDVGSTETGASADVLTAYRVIHEAGGLAIAAHANSTHGVALRDFPFGGQTKIAYTQDPNLDALEVTDLEGSRFSTARFFNGSKTEYPRRMHCIQGSDSHRVNTDPRNPKRLGIGERATEMMLDEASFTAIANLLRSTAFDRTRPARPKDKPFDAFAKAREEGNTLVQAFHDAVLKPGAKLDAVLNDICALANSAGGSLFVGASAGSKGRPSGVQRPRQVEDLIREALGERLTPQLDLRMDVVQSEGASILRIRVPKGEDRPYCLDDHKFYVRDEDETSLAVRDEIIAMVLETMNQRTVELAPGIESLALTDVTPVTDAAANAAAATPAAVRNGGRRSGKKSGNGASAAAPVTQGTIEDAFYLPQMGVEIVESETRNGNQYHTIRDLRTGNVVRNISRRSAKDLWNYAIKQHETGAVKPGSIKWQGNIGLIHFEKRAGKVRYDLALRENGTTRIFYGVTEDGMEGAWTVFVQEEPVA